jgi:hypothetical protein
MALARMAIAFDTAPEKRSGAWTERRLKRTITGKPVCDVINWMYWMYRINFKGGTFLEMMIAADRC